MAEEFNGNSNKMKAYNNIGQATSSDNSNEPQIEKVIDGKVIMKKKSFGEKLKSALINEDIENIKEYILYDVVIPVIKEAFAKTITNTVNSVFGTDIRVPSSATKNSRNFNYASCSRKDGDAPINRINRGVADYDNFILPSREEAERVLRSMDEVIAEYGRVTIAELFEFCGETAPYTAGKYGWRNLSLAESQKVRDGYWLKLPRATLL